MVGLKKSNEPMKCEGAAMGIDPKIAQTIVSNIKDVLQHEINFFDTSGTIIASTDIKRIGTFHAGALLAVTSNTTVVVDSRHQFQGARDGINVPVLFNGSVVAVVGVTGRREEVESYVNVIKKMTEILIRENLDQITRFDKRMMISNLVTLLSMPDKDIGLVNTLAATLQIDLNKPRLAVLGKAVNSSHSASLHDDVYRLLGEHRELFDDCIFSVTPQECCMYVNEQDAVALRDKLVDIRRSVEGKTDGHLVFGIGEVAEDYTEYWESYNQASVTMQWQRFANTSHISRYSELDYGLFIDVIPFEESRRFVRHVFGTLSCNEIGEFRRVFSTYVDHNGSVTHAAQSLFIHKNTMQNRLNRIAAKTGYNPRNLKDYAILDLAFRLYDYLEFTGEYSRD
jgi:carbohydrate diacid regulator